MKKNPLLISLFFIFFFIRLYSQSEEEIIQRYNNLFNPQIIKQLYSKFKKGKLTKQEIDNLKKRINSSNSSTSPSKPISPQKSKKIDFKKILEILEKNRQKNLKKTPPLSKFFETRYGNLLILVPGGIIGLILLVFIYKKAKQLTKSTSQKLNQVISQKNLELADSLVIKKDYHKAINKYHQARDLIRESEYSWKNYIKALIETKNYSNAISELEEYGKKYQLRSDDLLTLIQLSLKKGDKQKAIFYFSQILSKYDLSLKELETLKKMAYQLNDHIYITEVIKKLLEKTPNHQEYLEELAKLYLEKKSYSEAIIILEKIKEINPANSFSYLHLAQLYLENNSYPQAVEELSSFFEKTSKYDKEAHKTLTKIISHNPNFIEAKYLLVKLLEKKNKYLKELEPLYQEVSVYYSDILIDYFNYLKHFGKEEKIKPALQKHLANLSGEIDLYLLKMVMEFSLSTSDKDLFKSYWDKLDFKQKKEFWNILKTESPENLESLEESLKYYYLSIITLELDEKEAFSKYAKYLIELQPEYDIKLAFEFLINNYQLELYQKKIKKIYSTYPDEPEAIFLALCYQIYSSQQEKDLMLEKWKESINEKNYHLFPKSLEKLKTQLDSFLFWQLKVIISKKIAVFSNINDAIIFLSKDTEINNKLKPEIDYQLAKFYLQEGKKEKAKSILLSHLSTPQPPEKILKLLIQLLFESDSEWEKAFPLIEKLIFSDFFDNYKLFLQNILLEKLENNPNHHKLIFLLGLTLIASGKTYKSFLLLDKSLKYNPNYLIKLVALMEKRPPQKTAIWKYFIKKLLELEEDIFVIEKFISTSPASLRPDDPEALILKASFLAKKGNYKKAQEILTQLEEKNNLNQDTRLEIARLKQEIYLKMGEKRKALEILEKIEKDFGIDISQQREQLEEQITNELYRKGKKALEEKNFTAAISYFQRLLQKNIPEKEKWQIRLYLATAFLEKSFFDLGFNELLFLQKQLFSAPSPNLELLYQLGNLLETYGYQGEAIETYKFILSKDISYKDVFTKIEKLKKITSPNSFIIANQQLNNLESLLAPRYQNFSLLGEGGTSLVFRAWDEKLERPVAIKALKSNLLNDKIQLERFVKTAKAISKFTHPNIAKIYDIEEKEGHIFLIMELVEGENLRKIIEEKTVKLDLKHKIKILTQIAQAISYAHSFGIIHRDIKPENIILEKTTNLIKVMDFGLAKIEYLSTMTKTGIKMGTPYYMSPEQIRGEKTTPATDIYSFGMVAYEILTERKPFSEGDLTYLHLYSLPPLPTSINPEIPEEMENIIIKCIQKNPEERFFSAEELLNRLQNVRI